MMKENFLESVQFVRFYHMHKIYKFFFNNINQKTKSSFSNKFWKFSVGFLTIIFFSKITVDKPISQDFKTSLIDSKSLAFL